MFKATALIFEPLFGPVIIDLEWLTVVDLLELMPKDTFATQATIYTNNDLIISAHFKNGAWIEDLRVDKWAGCKLFDEVRINDDERFILMKRYSDLCLIHDLGCRTQDVVMFNDAEGMMSLTTGVFEKFTSSDSLPHSMEIARTKFNIEPIMRQVSDFVIGKWSIRSSAPGYRKILSFEKEIDLMNLALIV